MPFKPVVPQVYELNLGLVNLWLIEDPAGLTLIDTGYPGQAGAIVGALERLGKKPEDIHHILLTHCHPDHTGSLAALKKITRAQAWMHAPDSDVVRGGTQLATDRVSPGLLNTILFHLFIKNTPAQYPHAEIEHEVQDDPVLPFGGGIRVIHTPGHSSEHSAYWLPHQGGILIIGDACSNIAGLGYSILYEDIEVGRASLRKLAGIDCQTICFSHGKALRNQQVAAFKQKWS